MRRAVVVFALGAVTMGGCTAAGPDSSDRGGLAPVADVSVPAPPGLKASQIEPRKADALARGHLPLTEILDRLPRPTYLNRAEPHHDRSDTDPSSSTGPPTQAPHEPPLAAQRSFIAGRQAWLDGYNFKAISHLEDAHRIAPTSPAIARLLGRIHSNSNPVQAAVYLKKAVSLDPTSVDSLFLLGRHAMRQGKWDEAIATFAHALSFEADRNNIDPMIWPLSHYHLADALDRAGYERAAIDHYLRHLKRPPRVVRSTRFARQLYFLRCQRGLTWQRIGDAHHRMGQPAEALHAYIRASQLGIPDSTGLVSRIAYTQLRLGRPEAAQNIVVRRLSETQAEERTVQLLEYLIQQGVDRALLAGQLRQAYEESDRSPDMALSIVALLNTNEGTQLLRDHLSNRPADSAVFTALIRRLLAGESGGGQTVRAVEAIEATAATITALPAAADRYANDLLDVAADPTALLEAFEAINAEQRHPPAMRYLHGMVLARADRGEDAIAEYEQVLEAMPDLADARLALAALLVDRQEYERARQLLEPLAATDDVSATILRTRVMAASGELGEALKLLDEQITKHPARLKLVIQKAKLQIEMDDVDGAELTLLDKLDSHPKAERLYDELFELYQYYRVSEREHQYQKLLSRLLLEIPESWLARLKRAEALMAIGDRADADQAEQELKKLMSERPRDYRGLHRLLELLWLTGRRAEANELIDRRIAEEPKNAELLRKALQHYSPAREDNRTRFYQVMVMLLLTQPDSEERALHLGSRYILLDMPAKAVEVIMPHLKGDPKMLLALVKLMRQALTQQGELELAAQTINETIARFEQHRGDLLLELAMLYEDFDDRERAEQTMLESLNQDPDHAHTNNALGYMWADRGVNLERAEQMIRKALEAEPANAAIRDSLGWVLYKRGRFADAVRELGSATRDANGDEPIILDHLGDAYYRLGRSEEAKRAWTRAQSLFDPEMARYSSELKGLDGRLRQKLDALKAQQPPEVADVPAPPNAQEQAGQST